MKKIILLVVIVILQISGVFGQYGHWEKLNPEHNPGYRAQHKMAQIDGNKVLLFGGENSIDALNDTWIFDLKKNDWIKIDCKNNPSPRYRFGMCSISEKRILIFGGTNFGEFYNDLWFFDIDSLNWFEIKYENDNKFLAPLPTDTPGLCEINDSLVLSYGGSTFDTTKGELNTYTEDSWVFNLNQMKWKFLNLTYPRGRAFPMLENFGINKIFMCGGGSHNNQGNENWLFNIDSIYYWQEFELIKKNLPVIRGGGIARVGYDNIIIFGGWTNTINSQDTWYDSTWVFISKESSWFKFELALHPSDRYLLGMSRIDSNKALLYGGSSKNNPGPNDTWIFELDSIPTNIYEKVVINTNLTTYINSKNQLIIDYPLPENSKAEIEIFNINGISIFKENNIEGISGWNRESVDISSFVRGVYFVTVKSGMFYSVSKFVVCE